MTREQSSIRLGELDALRGIAAMLVLLFHYTFKAPQIYPAARAIDHGLSWGGYGVELFFAISGFVIFMTLERTRTSADFLVSRFARLFPAYWTGVVVTSLLLILLGATDLAQPGWVAAVNLTMIEGFLYLPYVDGVYWSLTVELSFYFCMWALWRSGLLDRIETVLTGWIALVVLWWAAPALPSRLGLLLVIPHIPYFAIGILAYRLRSGRRAWRQQLPVLLAAAAAMAVTGGAAAVLAVVIIAAIFGLLATGRLNWLARRELLWLGSLSYPVYLVHQLTGYAVIARLESLGASPALALIGAVAFALALAQAIHTYVETPALKAIRLFWRDRQQRALA